MSFEERLGNDTQVNLTASIYGVVSRGGDVYHNLNNRFLQMFVSGKKGLCVWFLLIFRR